MRDTAPGARRFPSLIRIRRRRRSQTKESPHAHALTGLLAAAEEAPTYDVAFVPPEWVLVLLGFTMVLAFMTLIMTKRLTPMVALILVPTAFGLFAGAGLGLGDMILDSIGKMAPTAALLMFAIMFFGIMIDVGLFDPLIRVITRVLGDDPAKVVLGTAILAGAVSLDGDGSTTFIITTSAMLPIYLRLGMSPVVLTCVAGLMNGTLNIVPWGGPTVRAATALGLQPTDIFVPMLPALGAGLIVTLGFAWILGLQERRRLGAPRLRGLLTPAPTAERWPAVPADLPRRRAQARRRGGAPHRQHRGVAGGHGPVAAASRRSGRHGDGRHRCWIPPRPTLRPKLIWFNLVLTRRRDGAARARHHAAAVRVHGGGRRRPARQLPRDQGPGRRRSSRTRRASSASSRWSSPPASSSECSPAPGMVDAMANWITNVLPPALGPFLAPITGILSIPFTFFMSNDAFYFGILPVLAQSAANFGIDPVEMARASITGQPVHLQSPLVPAILLLVSPREREPGRSPPQGAVACGDRVARDARRRHPDRRHPVLRRQ